MAAFLRPPGRAVRRWQALPALERDAELRNPRRPASLMHAYIVVSLMAGVRPREARAIGWDVDLDGSPPSVAVLCADRAGETRRPRGRTETVYRQELRPILEEGAEVMDRLFGAVGSGLVEKR